MRDKAWKICQKNGGIWGEHPDHPKDIWSSECLNNDTVIGYWDWVSSRIEQEEWEEE